MIEKAGSQREHAVERWSACAYSRVGRKIVESELELETEARVRLPGGSCKKIKREDKVDEREKR